jgi:type III pantothenate kinase
MLLIDAGNSFVKFYEDGKIRRERSDINITLPSKKFYYICVNPLLKPLFESAKNGVNLEEKIKLKSSYKGLGVDRMIVCKAVRDGVIVDAGSAITVDVMDKGEHRGGVIMLGINSFRESFANISSNLEFELDPVISLDKAPNNTKDALNFALFGSIKCLIDSLRGDKQLIFCGGDADLLSRLFKGAVYKEDLVFEGMKEVIKECGC